MKNPRVDMILTAIVCSYATLRAAVDENWPVGGCIDWIHSHKYQQFGKVCRNDTWQNDVALMVHNPKTNKTVRVRYMQGKGFYS